MAYDPEDATTARALLEDALAWETAPALTEAQVDRAFALASSLDDDGVTVLYTSADLNKAAAWGWNVKAAAATAEYEELRAASGATLKRELADQCKQMAIAYGTGTLSVTGESTARGGIRSIGLATSTSAEYWDLPV